MNYKTMLKKITCFCIIFSLINIPGMSGASNYFDVEDKSFYSQSIELLTGLGVVSGNGDGSFNPDGLITRAEAAKMVCSIMNLDHGAVSSLFKDVSAAFWGVGYINATAQNGIFTGYPGGWFGPNDNLTYAQAITLAVRMLGYNSSNINGTYPTSFINKARSLGLLDNLSFDDDAYIDRKNVAYIFANAIQTDMESGEKLISLLDYTMTDECTVLANYNSSSSEISTSIGNYKYKGEKSKYFGSKVKLVIDRDNKVKCVIPLLTGKTYGVANILGNEITYIGEDGRHTITLSNSDRVIFEGAETTYGNVKSTLGEELQITMFYDDGEYDYCVLEECELSSPVVATVSGVNPFGISAYVVRNGEVSSNAGIKANDVCYYSRATNTVYAYCDTVLGVYEKAIPDKSNPTKVKISNKEYNIETATAAEELSHAEYDKYIEVLLGKDGGIVALKNEGISFDVSNNQSNVDFSTYGVVVSSQKKTVDGKEGYYVTCINSNGEGQDFKVLKNRNDLVGKIVKYGFNDGYFLPSIITNNNFYGEFDKYNRKISSKFLSDDCKIFDVYVQSDEATASVKEVSISDVSSNRLDSNDVLGYVTNQLGDICLLYLNNVTLLNMDIGIVTSTHKSTTASYTIAGGFSEKTYSSGVNMNVGLGKAVAYKVYGGRITKLVSLYKMIDGGTPVEFDASRIKTNKVTIDLVPSTAFYEKNKTEQYMQVEFDEINLTKVKKVSVFTDLRLEDGGRGRVVVIEY